MTVAVAVLDRDDWGANTDNLAVVEPAKRRIVSLPRDLWCPALGDRINTAWSCGGAGALAAAIAEHGWVVDHVLCLRRSAVELALEHTTVEVAVPRRLEYLYPLAPTRPIEEGAQLVVFDPPCQSLSGERIHQWLGARKRPGRAGSDLDRISRQQAFVRSLLAQRFDFRRCIADPERVRLSDAGALAELRGVRSDWRFEIFEHVVPQTVDGKQVLVANRSLATRLRSLVAGRDGRHG